MRKNSILVLFLVSVLTRNAWASELSTASGIVIPDSKCAQSLSLQLAREAPVYRTQEVVMALEKLEVKEHGLLRTMYEDMIQRGGQRFVLGAPPQQVYQDLEEHSPNHREVIRDIANKALLHRAANEPMQITPILLLGDPGVGKTHFARKLAQVIGTEYEVISMGSTTAGWIITGASSQWKGSRPGKVASKLIEGHYANPVIVVDEIDKAGRNEQYDPLGGFYTLMEPDSAGVYRDEFVNVDIDASHVLWIATANDESRIPRPILDRMNVYVIPLLSKDEARKVAQKIYSDFLSKHPAWEMEPELRDEVLDLLQDITPRAIRRVLDRAFGLAAADNRRFLLQKDIDLSKVTKEEKRPIGFIQ